MKKILLIVFIAFILAVCIAPLQSQLPDPCLEFAIEPVRYLLCPQDKIQNVIFQDLRTNCSSGLKITPVLHNNKKVHHLYIGSGRVKIDLVQLLELKSAKLGKKVDIIAVIVWAKHFAGSMPQPIVEAYDSNKKLLDQDVGPIAQYKLDRLAVVSPGISYIVIEGTEVAILKICFMYACCD